MDSFKTGKGIPSCQLTAVWTKPSKPSMLIHQVALKGVKESSNYLHIVLDCDSIPPVQGKLLVQAISLSYSVVTYMCLVDEFLS